jgi:hypothetical protein
LQFAVAGAGNTHLIDLHRNQQVVILQIHSVRLPDEPGYRLDDGVSLHRVVVSHVRAYAELQSPIVSHVVPNMLYDRVNKTMHIISPLTFLGVTGA